MANVSGFGDQVNGAGPVVAACLAGADGEAERLGVRVVGDEHLLIAVLEHSALAVELLGETGLSAARVRRFVASIDRRSTSRTAAASLRPLGELGIEVEQLRDRLVDSFGGDAVLRAARRVDRRHGRCARGLAREVVCGRPVLCKLALGHAQDVASALGASVVDAGHVVYGLLAVCDEPVGAHLSRRARADLVAVGVDAAAPRMTSLLLHDAGVDVARLRSAVLSQLTAAANLGE